MSKIIVKLNKGTVFFSPHSIHFLQSDNQFQQSLNCEHKATQLKLLPNYKGKLIPRQDKMMFMLILHIIFHLIYRHGKREMLNTSSSHNINHYYVYLSVSMCAVIYQFLQALFYCSACYNSLLSSFPFPRT